MRTRPGLQGTAAGRSRSDEQSTRHRPPASKPFDLLLGRKTFELFAAHWPYVQTDPAGEGYNEREAPVATLFNSVTKHVATRSPGRKLDWQNSRSLGSDVPAAVRGEPEAGRRLGPLRLAAAI